MKTIKRYPHEYAAEWDADRLRAAGIPAQVLGQALGLTEIAVIPEGYIELVVQDADEAEARLLLERWAAEH